MQIKRVLLRFLIFGLMGLLMELLFGVAGDLIRQDWDLRGGSSLWMIIDYGLFGLILMPIARRLMAFGIPLPVRAVFYMLFIFFVEYTSGILFHKVMGIHVWNYDHLAYNLHGQIAPHFIPAWYALGLAGEWLYRRVDACALLLAKGLRAGDIEAVEPAREKA
jgi:uncharacterized membrane protein